MCTPSRVHATEHIGLIATASTSCNSPYDLARRFASLDIVSGAGRTGTSSPPPVRRPPATNDYDYAVADADADEAIDEREAVRRARFTSIKYRTVHPVVRVHPLTGERGLFIGGFAQRIVGLSPGESRKVLDLLQAYITRPENVPPSALVAEPARAVRQPHHPALRRRQPRRPAASPAPGDGRR
ncbi:hypothetical protein GCM10027162_62270 [Streptomyces incanus]